MWSASSIITSRLELVNACFSGSLSSCWHHNFLCRFLFVVQQVVHRYCTRSRYNICGEVNFQSRVYTWQASEWSTVVDISIIAICLVVALLKIARLKIDAVWQIQRTRQVRRHPAAARQTRSTSKFRKHWNLTSVKSTVRFHPLCRHVQWQSSEWRRHFLSSVDDECVWGEIAVRCALRMTSVAAIQTVRS